MGFQIPKPKRNKNTVTLTPQIKKLESKLITLLQGDRDAAKRLIKQQNRMNRGRSYQWCLEKVIYDIERDRGF